MKTAPFRRSNVRFSRTTAGGLGRFIESADRTQATLLPEAIDDYVSEDKAFKYRADKDLQARRGWNVFERYLHSSAM